MNDDWSYDELIQDAEDDDAIDFVAQIEELQEIIVDLRNENQRLQALVDRMRLA